MPKRLEEHKYVHMKHPDLLDICSVMWSLRESVKKVYGADMTHRWSVVNYILFIYMYIYIYMKVYINIYTKVFTYIFGIHILYMYVCIYIYMYIYIYTKDTVVKTTSLLLFQHQCLMIDRQYEDSIYDTNGT